MSDKIENQTNDIIDFSDIESLEAIALLLLKEVSLVKRKQFSAENNLASGKISLHEEVSKFEADLICEALIRANGKQSDAAQFLGVKLSTLNCKIRRYKIDIDLLLTELE